MEKLGYRGDGRVAKPSGEPGGIEKWQEQEASDLLSWGWERRWWRLLPGLQIASAASSLSRA